MKIPVFVLSAVVAALFALEGWTLSEVVKQGQDLAAIKAVMNMRQTAQR
jgi:hypothetical protein